MSVETLQASLPNDSHLLSFEEISSESAELSAGPSLTASSTLILGEILAKQPVGEHKDYLNQAADSKVCKLATAGPRKASLGDTSDAQHCIKAVVLDRRSVVGLSSCPAPLAEEFYDTWEDGADNSTEVGPSCVDEAPSSSPASPWCRVTEAEQGLAETLGYSATQLSISLGDTAAAVLAEVELHSPEKAAVDTLLDLSISQLGTSPIPSPRSDAAGEDRDKLQLTQVVEDLFGGTLSLSETAFDEVALNLTATLAELSRSMSPAGCTNKVELPDFGETDTEAVKEVLGAARCATLKEEPVVKKQLQAAKTCGKGPIESTHQKVSIDQERLKAFSAAVEGAAGLDESLQSELLRLLNSWDTPPIAMRA